MPLPQCSATSDPRPPFTLVRLLTLTLAALLMAGSVAADWTYRPLSAEQISELRNAIAEMKANPRGPWLRIRWFCNDGSVLPPEPFACRGHGGGHQYAQMRPEIERFADWGFHFGTIYRAMSAEDFLDRANSGYRLQELVLQDYLEGVDNGWILREARYYRGARQAEDEEVRGRELLEILLSDGEWRRAHPLLATQLAGVVPHGALGVPGAGMRELATRIAEQDPRFQSLRVKIHSSPGPGDLAAVQEFGRNNRSRLSEETAELLAQLVAELEQAYRVEVDAERWESIAAALRGTSLETPARGLASTLSRSEPRERLALLGGFLAHARDAFNGDLGTGRAAGRTALDLLDAIHYAGAVAFAEATRWIQLEPAATRAELLQTALDLVDAAYGTGWLTGREREALRAATTDLLALSSPTGARYLQTVRYLAGAADWGLAALTQSFGPALERYAAVEPLGKRFPDDTVRGSLMLPLASLMEELGADATEALDMTHVVFGQETSSGVLALNPGLALGRLRVIEDETDLASLDPTGIYVLPETPADLGRVAGILTLDQGSRLSHVQLLARGLGIPNAMIESRLLPALRQRDGQLVRYAVSRAGAVALAESETVSEAPTGSEATAPPQTVVTVPPPEDGVRNTFRVDTDRLDLSQRSVIRLSEVDVDDSGRTVGPKAANLGRLHSLFPDRVEPGLVIPFGVFRAHVERDLDGDGRSLHQEIVDIFREEREAEAAGEDPDAIQSRVLARLETLRARIRNMRMLPEFRAELEAAMATAFGPPGSYGVFVRSDTNVEDLPNFSGAGLNLTVMNVIGTESVISAIKEVWASPFTQRSYVWRQRLIRNPEAVYPSIVLLKSVPSEASGVLVTADIAEVDFEDSAPDEGIWTVTLAQGVGAVVDGGAAETVLLPATEVGGRRPVLLSSARAIWAKRLISSGGGGIERIPVVGAETLLTPARIDDLRLVVREILERYPRPRGEVGERQPWDIEFGFIGNRTILFQIRPFITGRAETANDLLQALDRRVVEVSRRPIDLSHRVTLETNAR